MNVKTSSSFFSAAADEFAANLPTVEGSPLLGLITAPAVQAMHRLHHIMAFDIQVVSPVPIGLRAVSTVNHGLDVSVDHSDPTLADSTKAIRFNITPYGHTYLTYDLGNGTTDTEPFEDDDQFVQAVHWLLGRLTAKEMTR